MFTTATEAAVIGELALVSGSNWFASPSSGGVKLGITVFTPNVVVNEGTYYVLEVYVCETLVLFTVSQQ